MHEKNYQETVMSGFIQLRTSLIKQLAAQGLTILKSWMLAVPQTVLSLLISVNGLWK
jgi:hypothetical protein